MTVIRWERYPLVAQRERSRSWLQIQGNLGLASKTIDGYGRSLTDYLDFCARYGVAPETITREQFALYVQDLASRPNRRGATILSFDSGSGLANTTMQLRITVARLYHDYLVERQLRPDNPIGRGHYVPGKGFGGVRQRGLLTPIFKSLLFHARKAVHHRMEGVRSGVWAGSLSSRELERGGSSRSL
jgi:integrase/recombinase XerD